MVKVNIPLTNALLNLTRLSPIRFTHSRIAGASISMLNLGFLNPCKSVITVMMVYNVYSEECGRLIMPLKVLLICPM